MALWKSVVVMQKTSLETTHKEQNVQDKSLMD